MKREEKFMIQADLVESTAHAKLKEQDAVLLNVTVCVDDEHRSGGWYEFYDEKTGGETWYAGGELEITDNTLTGYDGAFELADFIVEHLETDMGVKIDL